MSADNKPQFVTMLPDGVECVGMTEHNGVLYLALTNGVYRLQEPTMAAGGRFVPVPIQETDK